MKIQLMLAMLCVLTVSPTVNAQNTIKLFDTTAIHTSVNPNPPYIFANALPFAVKEVYLSCIPGDTSMLSGPMENGRMVVDNFLTVNGTNVCPGADGEGSCFSTFVGPNIVGQPIESAFTSIEPLNISSSLTGSGVFTFRLMDFGGVYGNTEINLTTTCQIVTQICHRNHRKKEEGQFLNIDVSPSAIPAHVAHGDTLGPCPTGN